MEQVIIPLRIAGLLALLGAFLYAIGDVLLLASKVKLDDYPRLKPFAKLLSDAEKMVVLSPNRMIWGALLGVFATPLVLIGMWQVLAMIPGVSRSAASIIGGMQQKLTRNFAAEFSFFLAVPTMFAASAYSLFLKDWEETGIAKKGYELIVESQQNINAFIVGNVVAFIVAILAIRFFINYLKVYGFRVFGMYRIIVGIILLILIFTGYLG